LILIIVKCEYISHSPCVAKEQKPIVPKQNVKQRRNLWLNAA